MARIQSLRGKRRFAMKPSTSVEMAGCAAPCTFRTSMPITAALKTGCTISTGSRRNTWRIIWVGDGQSTCGASTRPKASSERRWGFSTANGESAKRYAFGALHPPIWTFCRVFLRFGRIDHAGSAGLARLHSSPGQQDPGETIQAGGRCASFHVVSQRQRLLKNYFWLTFFFDWNNHASLHNAHRRRHRHLLPQRPRGPCCERRCQRENGRSANHPGGERPPCDH